MASTLISNPVTNSDRARESSKKKKRKKSQNTSDQIHDINDNHHSFASWKSESQQQAYSSKLLNALRQLRLNPSPSVARRGQAVRDAADNILAATAKGKTRWSRAILTKRLKLKFMKNTRQRVAVPGTSRSKKPRVSILRLKSRNLSAVERKVRMLGRLVPGCRKEPLPAVLEEATDYIAALEMQVRAMAALAEMLSGSNSGLDSSALPVSQLGPSWLS